MRILVDIGHPAHVHLFRNAMRTWQDQDHDLVITVRDKDITTRLLDLYGFEYHIASKARHGTIGLFLEMLEHDWQVLRVAHRHKCELLLGTSVAIAHASRFIPGRSVVFTEDDVQSALVFARITYPFADTIVTPDVLPDQLGKKHVIYPSYQELAYLHPNHFAPDPSVLSELGVEEGEFYSILRFVSLNAAHDKGQQGLSLEAKRTLVQLLESHGRIFITVEGALLPEFERYRIVIPPHRIHDALAFASIFVGDSQSMTVEAAVLGTPAIRCNTFVGRCPVIEELEHRYDLTYGYLPQNEMAMLDRVSRLLSDPQTKQIWMARRARMLKDKINLHIWMVNFIDAYFTEKRL
jgi:hypothetical protein